jgi:hypothetical protein
MWLRVQVNDFENNVLVTRAKKLDIDLPPVDDEEMWEQVMGWGKMLTPKGRHHVRKLCDEEDTRRREIAAWWWKMIILPGLSLAMGVMAAITGLVAVFRRH